MRLVMLALLFGACLAPLSVAQAELPWLIVPTTSGEEDEWIEPAARRVRDGLVERGEEVWSFDSAATRFEGEGSAPPAKITEAEKAAWIEQSRSALRHLAAGDYFAALKELEQVQEFAAAAPEELNRDPRDSQLVLDNCLFIVRALSETGAESRARAMAQDCRRLVPTGEPTPLMHPPAIEKVLAQVDASRAEQTGSIRVKIEPSGCSVRVSGVPMGGTPLELGQLFPGLYRVQADCDEEEGARVHTANVIAGPLDVFVDARFDRAVESEPLLHLGYDNDVDRLEHRLADAARVSAIVPAGPKVLLSTPAADVLDIELYRGEPLVLDAAARIPMGPLGPNRGDVALAVRALLQSECTDFTGPRPALLACDKPKVEVPVAPLVKHRPRGQLISGLTLLGVGSASLVTGYALLAPRANAATDWVGGIDTTMLSNPETQQKWLNYGTAIIFTGSFGAASLVAAAPLALPNQRKTPWWVWLSGGLGLGAAAASGYLASTVNDTPEPATSCDSAAVTSAEARACVSRAEATSLAVLVGVTAAPLLTVPLVYLIRPKRAKVKPDIQVSRAGAFFGVSGRF